MVGNGAVNFEVDLNSLYNTMQSRGCTFTPETFPGLIYKMAKPKVCLLIFSSGKIVLTGAKEKKDIDQAF